jgi:three-Cys-motif partner protein
LQKNISIKLLFNEFNKNKFAKLEKLVQYKSSGPLMARSLIDIKLKNEDFADLFFKELKNLKFGNSLLFLDQNGIKQITESVFSDISSLPKTDFLFFISSSYLNRFEFKRFHPNLQLGSDFKYSDIHRKVLDYYRGLLPNDSKLKLYPFTLKKPNSGNIYGLIFGSRHPLGIEKFLNIAWDKNKINGEANFDIDEDREKQQRCLPFECRKLTKLERFNFDFAL